MMRNLYVMKPLGIPHSPSSIYLAGFDTHASDGNNNISLLPIHPEPCYFDRSGGQV
ncbi:hypothetical protein SAMD00023353_1100160 [Rosellinia necatrix]|uniref:Uncharacterized protein n=1 Tax=Rosellinia necatrix TaxID=77044 RepID=A0A1S8A6F8_ROSNE|nr:hypothetical protein SAMD00023353_1100160 [Rosellinia necatrix]